MSGRHVRAARERLDVEWLGVLAIDPVAHAAQLGEVAQLLCGGRSARHLPHRATMASHSIARCVATSCTIVVGSNGAPSPGPLLLSDPAGGDLLDHVKPAGDRGERRVVRRECRIGVHEEELAAVGARPGVRHRDGTGRIGRAAEVLIREPIARPARACASWGHHIAKQRCRTS